jgi:Skp family chaperone for outer membrane proteins
MEIRVIDFEILTTHYKKYRDGVDLINAERKSVMLEVEPIRKEMNKIISSATTGLIIDGKTQQQQAEKFQALQQELVKIDNDFKARNKKMVDDLNTKSFDELSEIITEWAKQNSIDLVSGKMEIIFCNDKWDVTNDILEILKQQNLYVEKEITNEFENEMSENEKESI